jgi:hypothetical protein
VWWKLHRFKHVAFAVRFMKMASPESFFVFAVLLGQWMALIPQIMTVLL